MSFILALQPHVDLSDKSPLISYATLDTETGETETATRRMPNVSQNDRDEYEVQQILSRAAPCFPVDKFWKSEVEMPDRIIAYQNTHEGGYSLYPENTGGKPILKDLFTPLKIKHFLEREGADSDETLGMREILTDEDVAYAYESSVQSIDAVKRALASSVSHIETGNAWEKFCLGLCFADVKRLNRKQAEREALTAEKGEKRQAEKEAEAREAAERQQTESQEQQKTRQTLGLAEFERTHQEAREKRERDQAVLERLRK